MSAYPPRPKIPLAKPVFDEEMKEAAVQALHGMLLADALKFENKASAW
jgi:hypothetical protein